MREDWVGTMGDVSVYAKNAREMVHSALHQLDSEASSSDEDVERVSSELEGLMDLISDETTEDPMMQFRALIQVADELCDRDSMPPMVWTDAAIPRLNAVLETLMDIAGSAEIGEEPEHLAMLEQGCATLEKYVLWRGVMRALIDANICSPRIKVFTMCANPQTEILPLQVYHLPRV